MVEQKGRYRKGGKQKARNVDTTDDEDEDDKDESKYAPSHMDSEERMIQETLDKNTSELEAESNIDDVELDGSAVETSPNPTQDLDDQLRGQLNFCPSSSDPSNSLETLEFMADYLAPLIPQYLNLLVVFRDTQWLAVGHV